MCIVLLEHVCHFCLILTKTRRYWHILVHMMNMEVSVYCPSSCSSLWKPIISLCFTQYVDLAQHIVSETVPHEDGPCTRHKGMWWNGVTVAVTLNHCTRCWWVVSFISQELYLWRNCPSAEWTQSLCGHIGEGKISCLCWESKHDSLIFQQVA